MLRDVEGTRVLTVGAGNSGCDLAVDVAPPEQWHDVADKHVQVVVDFLAKNGIHAG